jgi:hypothetical protein
MKNLDRYFAAMRSFKGHQTALAHSLDTNKKALEPYNGSPYYLEKRAELEKDFEQRTLVNRQEAAAKIKVITSEMRVAAKKNLIQAPTAEMSATLGLLKLTDNLTRREILSYAESFKDCPLALKILKDIGLKFNILIQEPNFDIVYKRIDNLEGGAYNFINNFVNPADNSFFNMTYSRYFGDTADYKNSDWTVEQSEKVWLNEMTGSIDAECFEENAPTPTPEVTYKFKDIDELVDYMKQSLTGLDNRATEITKNEILDNLPGTQATKYRNFLATGEKLSFDEEETA